jgi:isocitrate dehydrogenase kinase/phosphatase
LIDKFQEKLEFSSELYSELIKQSKDEIDFDFQEDINEYIISLPKKLQFKIFDQYYNTIFCKIFYL